MVKDTRTVIVASNLSAHISAEDIKAIFSPCGKIRSCRVLENAALLKYASIDFETHIAAKKAVDALNESSWLGREMYVAFEMEDPEKRRQFNMYRHNQIVNSSTRRVCISNLQNGNRDDLLEHFAGIGGIEEITTRAAPNKYNSGVHYFAFICFRTEEQAQAAFELDGTILGENFIRVRPCLPMEFVPGHPPQ